MNSFFSGHSSLFLYSSIVCSNEKEKKRRRKTWILMNIFCTSRLQRSSFYSEQKTFNIGNAYIERWQKKQEKKANTRTQHHHGNDVLHRGENGVLCVCVCMSVQQEEKKEKRSGKEKSNTDWLIQKWWKEKSFI